MRAREFKRESNILSNKSVDAYMKGDKKLGKFYEVKLGKLYDKYYYKVK